MGAEYSVDAFSSTPFPDKYITSFLDLTTSPQLSVHPVKNSDAVPVSGSHNQLKILSWNINGDLKAKMLCPDILNTITQYDICLLQESHLYPLEHLSLNLPISHDVISLPRTYKKTFKKQFGGVIVFFKKTLNVSLNKRASSTDIMVLDLDHLTLVNVYILPEYQSWDKFSDVDPFQTLQETLTGLQGHPVIAMGDFNARTGLIASPNHPRVSQDVAVSTRGRALMSFCKASDFILLNGAQPFEKKSHTYTSFQPRGKAVVDYVIVNELGLAVISDFRVLSPQLEWSDHAQLSLELKPQVPMTLRLHAPPSNPSHKRTVPRSDTYNSDNPLDVLQRQIVQNILTPKAKLVHLYGHPHPSPKTLEVYTDGSCIGNGTENARAGSGVFWGQGSHKNLAVRVPGKQTNNRGEIFAILMALRQSMAQPRRTLKIFTDSVYAIKSLVDWAPANAEKGWKIENGDIIRDVVMLIKLHHGLVSLVQIKGHSNNKHNDAADKLAKEGALLPPVGPYTALDPEELSLYSPPSSPLDTHQPKVTATYIEEVSNSNDVPQDSLSSLTQSEVGSSIPPHRGHEKLRNIKIALR